MAWAATSMVMSTTFELNAVALDMPPSTAARLAATTPPSCENGRMLAAASAIALPQTNTPTRRAGSLGVTSHQARPRGA
jgi:hypothetical protein